MKQYLTTSEVQEILGLGKSSTYKLISQKDFPKVKIGGAYRIPKEEFTTYMHRHLYKEILFDQ